MNYSELENKLKSRIKKRRTILAVISAISLAALFICLFSYFASAEVEIMDLGFTEYRTVEYNDNYMFGVMIAFIVFLNAIILLILDFISCKFRTVEVCGSLITFYRGLVHVNLYVDGELKDSLSAFKYYLEARLNNGIKVNVAVGKWSAHMTFSNDLPPIDI